MILKCKKNLREIFNSFLYYDFKMIQYDYRFIPDRRKRKKQPPRLKKPLSKQDVVQYIIYFMIFIMFISKIF